MKKYLFFLAIIALAPESFSQDPISFNPDILFSELKKISNTSEYEIQEISAMTTDRSNPGGKYFSVTDNTGGRAIQYIYMGRVNSCRAGGCSVNREPAADGEHEYFDYFVFFDSIPSIRLVKIYNYQASHGQEVTARGWLRQFTGYDGSENLQVGKQIDAISGATISAWGITLDVQKRLEGLNGHIKLMPLVNK